MIKKIFNPGNYPQNINLILFLLRITIGAFMLTHGLGKFSKLFGNDPIKFADPYGFGESLSLGIAVFSEVFCSLFLIFGFATRFAAFSLLITMLTIIFVIHGTDGFGKQELPSIYAVIYFVITYIGAGKISIDNWIYAKINK